MVGESVAFLKAEGLRVFFDAEHFFDGYKRQPRVRPARARGRHGQRRRLRWCCATPTAARCPTRCSASPARSSSYFGGDVAVGIHTQNDSGCAVANSVAAVRRRRHPGAGHDQRLRRAHRQRQPHDGHPRPHPEDGRRPPCPRATSSGSPSVSHHVAELVNLPPHPADPYVGASAFAHKGGLHTSAPRPSGRRHLRAHRPRHRRQPHPRAGLRPRRPRRHVDEGHGVRRRARRPRRRRARPRTSSSSSRGLLLRGRPTPRSSCCMRRAAGWEQDFFEVEAYRVSSYHREGPVMPDDEVEVSTEATVKLWVDGERIAAVGEGNGPVNALDAARAAGAQRPLPGPRPHPPHRLQGARRSTAARPPAPWSGCSSTPPTASGSGPRSASTSNIIEASWQALIDSLQFGLLHAAE